ncbi:MAG TPA: serine/threonine-protein kinase [Gemmatimonadaceae bacterium]|nr:serine/threonine-protein kinase [Gemmatimonadaceae bacterium]
MIACEHCATELPDAAQYCYVCGRDIADDGQNGGEDSGPSANAIAGLKARLTKTLKGRYRVKDVLGAGGMGVVFLADDISLKRPVAIKVLPTDLASDKKVVARFRREAKTAAALDHPGIIPVLSVESDGGLHYFIMKYVAGRTLDEMLSDGRPLPIPFVMQVLREAAAALAHAHENGVVHRDVKPANIMLEDDDRVILTDFGISKVTATASSNATTAARLTDLGMVVGTPHYMAPEQAVGQPVDGRTDQYALGVVAFEMLTGRVPFDDITPHAIIQRHINEAPPDLSRLRPDAPPHVVAAIGRALSKAPSNRFATMQEFGAAVAGSGSRATGNLEFTVPAANITASSRAAEPARGRVRPWVAALMLLLVGGGGAAAWVGGGRRAAAEVAEVAPKPTPPKPVAPKPAAQRPVAGKEARRRTAPLSIASRPRATVFINDVKVGATPLANRQLTVGRTYRIRVERAGYRTKRETITATGSAPIRRSYVLERVRKR